MTGLTRGDLTTIATRTDRKVVAAWSSHDQGAMGTVVGVVMHHTGSAQNTSAIAPTLGIVRDGRSDLQNALSAYYIDKAGTIYLITEKVAWHAGQGYYRGITDANGHFIGIEAESDGVTWTTATVDAYVALVAEICRYLGVDVNTWAIRHATWATPPGRKTDFAGLSETAFKARANARLNTSPQEPDMPLTDADVQKLWWAETVDPVSGQKVQIIQLLKNAELGATNAARDAAIARKLAEQAAAGAVLTTAEIDAIAAQVATDLASGYKIAVVPPATA